MDHPAMPDRIKMEDFEPQHPATTDTAAPPTYVTQEEEPSYAPIIIGIYGIPGVGKIHLRKKLETQLDSDKYIFFEGSTEIDKATPGDFKKFKKADRQQQDEWRTIAINSIREDCVEQRKIGIVTGHFSYYHSDGATFDEIMTDADKKIYTHILYVYNADHIVKEAVQNDNDNKISRGDYDLWQIKHWMDTESSRLREVCHNNDIQFIATNSYKDDRATEIIRDLAKHNEQYNTDTVNKVQEEIVTKAGNIQKMVLFDADRTLSTNDSSATFFKLCEVRGWVSEKQYPCRPKDIFSSPLGYSYNAFRQATLLYEELVTRENMFNSYCDITAGHITLHPQLKEALLAFSKDETVGVIVVTSGIRRIWKKVLEGALKEEGIHVPVIGGGRFKDGYVVTPEVKGDLVTRLREIYGLHVTAIGDSPIAMHMLQRADKAFIVVGRESDRSQSMDEALQRAAENPGFSFSQILLPPAATPRLDATGKPWPISVFEGSSIVHQPIDEDALNIEHATHKTAASLLATNTRNADIHGWPLQEAHRKVGWYLATEYVSNIIGTQYFDMPSLQKDETGKDKIIEGCRLLDEDKTCIVPLMRGGEALAHGIFEAFPTAMFLHAKDAEDIKAEHVAGKSTIILADFVINTGDSIAEFVTHIRNKLDRKLRIIIVAGVVQENGVDKANGRGLLHDKLAGLGEVSLVALRISTNSYKGKGNTDTGQRLFNSTHLD